MFRRLKLAVGGVLDRKYLYRAADAIVRERARRHDVYYDEHTKSVDNPPYTVYFKTYEFKGGRVQLRYCEDGERLVEIAVYNGSRACIYPPPEKWAGMQHSGHGQGYRVVVYDAQLLRDMVAEVVEWCITSARGDEARFRMRDVAHP